MASPDGPSPGASDSRIDLQQFRRILQVDENRAVAVGLAKLARRSGGEALDHFAGLGVDGGGVGTAVVDGEDAFGFWFVADRVGPFAGSRFADFCQRLQIENGDAIGGVAAVGNESAVQVVGDGDSMDAVKLRNGSHDLAGVGIDYFHAGAMGDI